MWEVQLFKLNFDDREATAAFEVVKDGWLTMGERTKLFELEFAKMLGFGTECITVANCTAALQLALQAAGVGPGDEVVIPALTFVANVNTVIMAGAKPVIADCQGLENWNISLETIRRCITPRTKAVVVVHYAGYPCDMRAISEYLNPLGITLIEDVAHAPGAIADGRPCGTWGDIGCFSFYSNKNLSVGEGGMLSTKDTRVAENLRLLRSHGMTAPTLDRHQGRVISYDVAIPGLNLRLDEIRSAIGLVQLRKLSLANEKRRKLTDRYRANLRATDVKIPFPTLRDNDLPVCHILPVLLPEGSNRQYVIGEMKAAGIQTSIHYPPFWGFSAFSDLFSKEQAPNVEIISNRQLTLPLYPTMEFEEVDLVTNKLMKILNY